MKVDGSTVWSDIHGQDGAYSTALTATATGLAAGVTHTFRLRAANLHGWGAYSSEVPVVVSGVPDKPAAPTTELESLHVKISWVAPTDNFATITAYKIRIENAAGTILEESTHCDAAVEPIFSQRFCLVPMEHLRTAYSLTLGTLVEARVLAYNRNGWGAESDPNVAGVTIQTAPAAVTPVTNGSLTGPAQIQLLWPALTTDAETGAASIITYNLQWHGGADDYGAAWVSLTGEVSNYVDTSYIVSGGVIKGAAYRFRIRAKNIWGWGPYSATTQIVASAVPAQMIAVVTSIDIATGDLVLDWTAPEDNGSPITMYQVEIRDKVGVAWGSHPACDATTAALVAATVCQVPMLTLTSAPYSYALGDLIVVRAAAYNEKGFGPMAPENTAGGTAKTVPAAPSAPTRGEATTPEQVEVEWTALATTSETGGLPILSYALAYDAGSGEPYGGASWVDLVGYPSDSLGLSYTATGTAIVGGQAYVFAVRARNAIGWGPASLTASVVASSRPG
jgi:hypothetical protein